MSDIRGEKVKFGRGDIVRLHDLPSAQAHEPIVLHCTDRPAHFSVLLRLIGGLGAVVALLLVLVVATVESGLVDSPLNARALAALDQAVGPHYSASVDKTVLRFSSFGGLALKAENVTLTEKSSGENVLNAGSVAIVLDPIALVSGRVSPSSLDIDQAMFNPALLPKGPPIDFDNVRLDAIPDYQELAFDRLEKIEDVIAGNGLSRVRITNLDLPITGNGGRSLTLNVENLTFARSKAGEMSIDGRYALDGQSGDIALVTRGTNDASELSGKISGIPLSAIGLRRGPEGEAGTGIDAQADITLSAARDADGAEPRLELVADTQGGFLYFGGVGAQLKPTRIATHYDYARRSLEISPSEVHVGASSFPFTGGLIDLDRLADQRDKGFAIDLVFRNAVSAPEDTGEAPVRFDAKVTGRLIPKTKQLLFDQLGVSTPHGSLAGSLGLALGGKSPEVNFAMISDRLQAVAVKQLWPYWLAKKARQWVVGNIFGGTVTNGRIEVSMAADREPSPDGRLLLGEDELTITFDVADTRINIAGAIPPLRDASGHFELHGERIDININRGAAYMPSGRSVTVSGGTFRMPNTYDRPLMAEMDINLAGASDAVAELITYKPIDVLKRTQFTPEDFAGPIEANVKARFGLVRDQNPPPPEWAADIDLLGVDLKKPITGRNISQVEGELVVNPSRAGLKAKAHVDQVPLDIVLVEPIDRTADLKRELKISGTIGDKDRARLFPGLNDLLSGPLGLSVTTEPNGLQRVETDLGRTVVSLPWIGWTKGAGVPAKATFVLDKQDGQDSGTRLSDFNFSGDGFAVSGDVILKGASLNSARFDKVRLSAQDRYAVTIDRAKAGYLVKVQGDVADVRPVLGRLKANPTGAGGAKDGTPISLRATLGQVVGFNGETLGNVSLAYATNGSRLSALDLSAVTGSGQALVAKLGKGEGTLELTTGDAGALARLANIYRHMDGGLLNMRLKSGADGSWRGPVDIRKFKLTGEEKLRSMVSTPAGGRSLNEAVRSEIDTSSMHFQRGFAFVVAKGGTLRVENGVVRGEAVGATFQGTVRDGNNRMELTGTFMPAYGLNRLFAELPLIGFILGNGSDRGLIGITFKLTGPFDRPNLMVNPLSIIAPGVFRNIFEF
ncbi:hypothetical protein IB238_07835 [Rhizobium sp. ARZ01]|uniref:YhdP family protein n=1 Tax=Rhizobium sp. ARZ01 TaxID=2769313 RepID=UPI00177E01D8|nr:DUF3971 domain-containing protein [Rhizobium sp. ARZ01]MBD9372528.1 hypothetical protein [Rhizobium sp. ARZ01]